MFGSKISSDLRYNFSSRKLKLMFMFKYENLDIKIK